MDALNVKIEVAHTCETRMAGSLVFKNTREVIMSKYPTFRPCPTVNREFVVNTCSFDVDVISKEKIIHILQTYPEASFESDYDGDVFLVHEKMETQEEHDARVLKEERAVEQWQKEYAAWLEANERTREEKIKKAREEKLARAEKYKNPEYIEFLRLQAKMKEQGFI